MAIGQTVLSYTTLLEAFQTNPDRLNSAVEAATAQVSGDDRALQQGMIAAWHNAIGMLSSDAKPVLKKGTLGSAILHTPQNELASRLQTLLVKRATASGNVETVQAAQTISTPAGASFAPEVQSVKFSNDDLVGWLQMAPELIFKPPKAEWVTPPPVPQTIADNARIALFADWGTGLYGAPAIARSIEGLDRCEVVLHLGDTYYSGEDGEIRDRLIGNWPKRPDELLRPVCQLLRSREFQLDPHLPGHRLRRLRSGPEAGSVGEVDSRRRRYPEAPLVFPSSAVLPARLPRPQPASGIGRPAQHPANSRLVLGP